MATTTVSVPRGVAWTSLGTSPCSVFNPGPGAVLLHVAASAPSDSTKVGIPLGANEYADSGITGQNVYAIPVDVGVTASVTVTVAR